MKSTFKVDFLGIGPSKAGTTWLGHMLEGHPEICMAEPKEINYFNDSLSFNRAFDTGQYALGDAWYQTHFRHCREKRIKGEITPRYIIDPVVPQRIFNHNPELKLMVCLRSPYDRILSHYHSAKDYHQAESRPISQAIREEPEYIEACLYYKNILRFLPFFSLDRIFFVDMDDVKSNPEQLLRNVYTFLGVRADYTPAAINRKSNPARSIKSVAFRKWMDKVHRRIVAMGLSPLIRAMKKMGIGKALNRINSGPVEFAQLSTEDKQYINSRIKEDVIQLGILLKKDYSHWIKE